MQAEGKGYGLASSLRTWSRTGVCKSGIRSSTSAVSSQHTAASSSGR
ncbi:MAG: hypothetical protein AVDCRST_MAG66-971 [uncultured Pseudonocardia sp.]|uniref:Uncharacterized protein n=1 Tax=uncultured Pseudonocardia sp. TaxID=211455 RepID=A0A6J4NN65_9PSEU|nr:MAG: hypothetical protein AVDCRST_MAG66-971 [uncultured Pseudonocardia sp.]